MKCAFFKQTQDIMTYNVQYINNIIFGSIIMF